MEILLSLIVLGSLVGAVAYFAMAAISFMKKDGKTKQRFKLSGISLAILFVSAFIAGSLETVETETVATQAEAKKEEPTAEEVAAAKEKEEAEAKAKAEQEAKEKAEAEAKAKAEAEAKAKAEEEAKAKAEEERIAAEKALAEKRANAKPIDYPHLSKNPDRYIGEYVKYTGEIVQIQEGNDYTVIRLAVTQTSYGYNPSDVVWVEYEGYTDYVDGDVITVLGLILGEHKYKSQAGWDISVPAMLAESFE